MNETRIGSLGSVFKQVLVLFGLYTLIANATFLIGYHFLPEGFLRNSPITTSGQIANQPESFAEQFALTLLFNLGFQVGLIIILNFNQVKGMPAAYLVPLYLAIMGGLIPGSNSFVASDLDQYSVREGLALAYSIGMLETLGFILIIAGTVPCGVYQYHSWWQLSKPTQLMRIRDIRLKRWEWLAILAGVLLVICSSYRETLMAFGML
ncbi:MAG: hypothetical protein HZB51_25770 [Chloroflexi bacterium]|nr:hypothetical protein [Chloroflexota bacterium]